MKAEFDAPTEDSPELTADELATAKAGSAVFSEEFLSGIEAEQQRRRGRGPQKAPTKKMVTIRLSPEVLDHFQRRGPGWQRRIDETLKEYLSHRRRPAKTHRRSVRIAAKRSSR